MKSFSIGRNLSNFRVRLCKEEELVEKERDFWKGKCGRKRSTTGLLCERSTRGANGVFQGWGKVQVGEGLSGMGARGLRTDQTPASGPWALEVCPDDDPLSGPREMFLAQDVKFRDQWWMNLFTKFCLHHSTYSNRIQRLLLA